MGLVRELFVPYNKLTLFTDELTCVTDQMAIGVGKSGGASLWNKMGSGELNKKNLDGSALILESLNGVKRIEAMEKVNKVEIMWQHELWFSTMSLKGRMLRPMLMERST